MRIGLFGGAFDPPHIGHLWVARTALWSMEVDKVWLLPCWKHAFNKEMVGFIDRVKMCRILVKDEEHITVCTAEGEIESTRSIDIIRFILKNNLDNTFRFILGTDNYWKMKEWEAGMGAVALVPPLWVERPGVSRIPEKSYSLHKDVSSTEIRSKLARRRDCTELLHPGIIDYINKKKLYVNES